MNSDLEIRADGTAVETPWSDARRAERNTAVERAAAGAAQRDADEAARAVALEREAAYRDRLRRNPLDTSEQTLGHVLDDVVKALAEVLDHIEATDGVRLPAAPFRAMWAEVQAIKAELPKT